MGELSSAGVGRSPPFDELLSAAPLFAEVSAEGRAHLRLIADEFCCPAGASIFEQNALDDGVYLVGHGEVAIVGRTPGDGHRELARVTPGGVFGEFSLLDGGRRAAEARAETETHGFRIDLERFAAIRTSGNPAAYDLLRPLYREVAGRTRETLAKLAQAVGAASLSETGARPSTGSPCAPDFCRETLSTFPGFERFTAGDWAELAVLVERHELPRGTPLELAGTPAGALHLVARGALRTGLGQGDKAHQLLIHGPGSLSGAAAMLAGGDWLTSVHVREDAVVLALPPHAFAAILAAATPLARRLFDMLGRQLTGDLRRISRARTRLDLLSTPMWQTA